MKVLITGGAGFIGTVLTAQLAARGVAVTILDSLTPQIHGPDAAFPDKLSSVAECVRGDVRDRDLITQLLPGHDAVVHLAAETGTGQSMYEIAHYESVNLGGTAVLLDVIANATGSFAPPGKIVVASSRAIYGEGQYQCLEHGKVFPHARATDRMEAGHFEPACPICGREATSVPTQEDAPMRATSFYGLTKQVQEEMVLLFGRTLGIDAFALRYQNVYGPGQSLKNPYTGILAIFSNLARSEKPINIFEDGRESRDFVYVDDVAQATVAALDPQVTGQFSVNVGSGTPVDVLTVAQHIVAHFGSRSSITVTGDFRLGDIRHGCADLERARAVLNFEPSIDFETGLKRFLNWASSNELQAGGYEASLDALRTRGLMRTANDSKEV